MLRDDPIIKTVVKETNLRLICMTVSNILSFKVTLGVIHVLLVCSAGIFQGKFKQNALNIAFLFSDIVWGPSFDFMVLHKAGYLCQLTRFDLYRESLAEY